MSHAVYNYKRFHKTITATIEMKSGNLRAKNCALWLHVAFTEAKYIDVTGT